MVDFIKGNYYKDTNTNQILIFEGKSDLAGVFFFFSLDNQVLTYTAKESEALVLY